MGKTRITGDLTSDNNVFVDISNDRIGFGITTPTQKVHVSGNIRITGGIYDSNNSVGTAGSVLSSTGSGLNWIASGGGGSSAINVCCGTNFLSCTTTASCITGGNNNFFWI